MEIYNDVIIKGIFQAHIVNKINFFVTSLSYRVKFKYPKSLTIYRMAISFYRLSYHFRDIPISSMS